MPLVPPSAGAYHVPDPSLGVEERIVQDQRFWWNQFQYGRLGFEKGWYRNILFYLDHQWIRYEDSAHRWREENLKEWVPRPVTNRLAPAVNVVRSALMSADPRFSAEPRLPESDLSVSGARAARDALDILYADSQFRAAKRNMASWLVLTGTGFLGVDFSTASKYGSLWLPGERCVTCGQTQRPSEMQDACPQCGDHLWVEDGKAGESVPRGRLLTTSWSPFEVYIDSGVLTIEDQPTVILSRSYHVEVARAAWEADAARIKPTTGSTAAQYYLTSLATASTLFRGVSVPDHVVIRRIYRKPCQAWPNGLVATVTSDGVVLEHQESYPYRFTTTEQPFYPLLATVYDEVPGRFWGKTPVDSLVLKQAQRNRIEALYEMTLMTMAGPVWIIPAGSNPSKITGTPAIQITATPVSGMMPTRIQGMGPDASVIQMLEKIDQDFEEIMSCLTGDTEVPCLDGIMRTMAQLAQEFPEGGMWVYGFNTERVEVQPAYVERVWRSGSKLCVRVWFAEGTHVDCSYDHPFLTWIRGYVRADHLRPHEAVVPLVLHRASTHYVSVAQPVARKAALVHRMVARYLCGLDPTQKLDVHHRDENPQNNIPENLEPLTRREHIRRQPRGFSLPGTQRSPEEKRREQVEYWSRATQEQKTARMIPALIARSKNPALKAKWEAKLNHRVSRVEVLGVRPVYDLQTSTQNFGLSAGVFVHNTFSVMKGKQPGGVRAFQAMRLLQEQGMGRYGAVFENLEALYERWGMYALELHREFALTPLVRAGKNEFGQWTQQQFLKSDLSMDVDIRVESGSVRPKSSMAKLDAMQRLQAMGVLDARYPEQRLRMLEESGMLSMLPGVERDTEAAMRENAVFLKWAKALANAAIELQGPEAVATLMRVAPPPVTLSLLVDEHTNHYIYHRRFALTDDYRALPEPFHRWWEDVHMAGHLDAYQQLIARGGVPGQLPPLMPQKPTIAPPTQMSERPQPM